MRSKKELFEIGSTLLIVLCAVTVTTMTVYRNFSEPPAPGAPVEVDDWKTYSRYGHEVGSPQSEVTVVIFSDFQCPFCITFSRTMSETIAKRGDKIRFVFRHFPIAELHPFAAATARAAVCSAEQGRFKEFHDLAFSLADSISSVSWENLAVRAGVADVDRFSGCLADPTTDAQLDRDAEDAERLGVRGTPTLLVNQWKIPGALSTTQLDSVIASIIDE